MCKRVALFASVLSVGLLVGCASSDDSQPDTATESGATVTSGDVGGSSTAASNTERDEEISVGSTTFKSEDDLEEALQKDPEIRAQFFTERLNEDLNVKKPFTVEQMHSIGEYVCGKLSSSDVEKMFSDAGSSTLSSSGFQESIGYVEDNYSDHLKIEEFKRDYPTLVGPSAVVITNAVGVSCLPASFFQDNK